MMAIELARLEPDHVIGWVDAYAKAHLHRRSPRSAVLFYIKDRAMQALQPALQAPALPPLPEWTDFWQQVARVVKALYPNDHTRSRLYSEFQGMIKAQLGVRHPYLDQVYDALREPGLHAGLIKKGWGQTLAHNMQPRHVPLSSIKMMVARGHSPADWMDVALLLSLSLGTRIIELFVQNEFVAAQGLYPNSVQVLHVAKRRKDSACVRPVLFMPAEAVPALVHQLRAMLPADIIVPCAFTGGRHVNSNRVAELNDRQHRCLPHTTSHDLRKIYGYLAHAHYGGECNFNVFLSQVLGHDVDSIATSFAYSTVTVDFDVAMDAEMPVVPIEQPTTHLPGGFPSIKQVTRKMSPEERWATAQAAITTFQEWAIPVTGLNLMKHLRCGHPFATEVMKKYQ